MRCKRYILGALLIPLILGLSSCELLVDSKVEDQPSKNISQCPTDQQTKNIICDLDYWLGFWVVTQDLDWASRKSKIELLGDGKLDTLKKIFLSQGKKTPYQNRLRAQLWAESLYPFLCQDMHNFIHVSVYQPSQDLLEMESALVGLSRANTSFMEEIEQHKVKIVEQQNQIDQLMNIEASILSNESEEKK